MIFDGDDTLWITEPLYDTARTAAGRAVAAAGFDAVAWEQLQRTIDVENVAIYGLTSTRFPTSCVQAAERLAAERHVELTDDARKAVWTAAASVFERPAPLAPHARDTLEALQGTWSLALLTKGDPEVQQARISMSGLEQFFETVEIVDEKTASVFAEVVAMFEVAVGDVWSVGNSLRSDILPALEAGLHAVLVDAHVWEYERFERTSVPKDVPVLADLGGLTKVLHTQP